MAGNTICAQAHKDETGDLVILTDTIGRYFVLPSVMGCKGGWRFMAYLGHLDCGNSTCLGGGSSVGSEIAGNGDQFFVQFFCGYF